MRAGTKVAVRVHVDSTPDALYAMVSDVSRMHEWSPETTRCTWVGGATAAAPGARFRGTNRRGIVRWSTTPEVTTASPGKEFAFVTHGMGPSTKWSYQFLESPGRGTDVVESFEMLTNMPRVLVWLDRYLLGIRDRKADLAQGMTTTLQRIKAAAEATKSSANP